MKSIKMSFLFALILFGLLSLALLFQGNFHIFGESFMVEFYFFPIIIIGITIVGTIKQKKWFVMPFTIFIVFNLYYYLFFQEILLVLVTSFTVLSLLVSTITSLISNYINKPED